MATARDILASKGFEIWTIGADDMVLDAIKEMDRKDVGALLVITDGIPVGIFTERHYARNVFLKGRASPTTPVKLAMRDSFVYVNPERTVEECMALMTEHKVRHLPVMEEGKVIGMLSQGDLVKSMINDREFQIEQLTKYISGTR